MKGNPEAPVEHIRNLQRYATLAENRSFSFKFLADLEAALAGRLSGNVLTVAIAGSFGRLEGSLRSDADYVLVVSDGKDAAVEADRQELQSAISKLGVDPPNKSGVFATARTPAELIETVGDPREHVDQLGKRLLLLLESRPVFGAGQYDTLLGSIFDKYAEYPRADHAKEFVFLLNDLIRYFRYICVNYQANFWRENEKWALRNLKLRHSRVVMYAGLLFLIGEASRYQDDRKLSTVRDGLRLTPLERLAKVYELSGDFGFPRVLGLYNVFLSRVSDANWRRRITAVDYQDRYSLPEFSEMKANSDSLVAELTRFVWPRRGSWSDRFYEYLVF